CQEFPLGYLTEAAVGEYLAGRFAGSPLPAKLARVIHRRTEGNPLFMVTIVDYLIAQGALVAREGQWHLNGKLEAVEAGVPENLQQLIERQLERLSPEDQEMLEVASVAGTEFSAAAVAAGVEATVGE